MHVTTRQRAIKRSARLRVHSWWKFWQYPILASYSHTRRHSRVRLTRWNAGINPFKHCIEICKRWLIVQGLQGWQGLFIRLTSHINLTRTTTLARVIYKFDRRFKSCKEWKSYHAIEGAHVLCILVRLVRLARIVIIEPSWATTVLVSLYCLGEEFHFLVKDINLAVPEGRVACFRPTTVNYAWVAIGYCYVWYTAPG